MKEKILNKFKGFTITKEGLATLGVTVISVATFFVAAVILTAIMDAIGDTWLLHWFYDSDAYSVVMMCLSMIPVLKVHAWLLKATSYDTK